MKPFDRAIFHFGADKTGSTSIQAAFDRERGRLLRDLGIAYPPGTHHAQLGSCFSDDPLSYLPNFENGATDERAIRAADTEYLGELERWLDGSAAARILVLSYEGFLDLDRGGLERLHAFGRRLAASVHVVIYVRPVLSYATSAMSQRVRMGRRAWDPDDLPLRRFRDHLAPVVDVFGRSAVEVRRFGREALLHGDVVADFCTVVGLESAEATAIAAAGHRLNARLTEQAMAFGSGLRGHLESAGHRLPPREFERRFGGLLGAIEGNRFGLTAERAEALVRAFAPHADYLRDTFGVDLSEEVAPHLQTAPAPRGEVELATSLGRLFGAEMVDRLRVTCGAGGIDCAQPPRAVAAGSTFELHVVLHNRSTADWPATGPHPVRVSYHWLSAGREIHCWEGLRSALPTAGLPGRASIAMTVAVATPREPGSYILQLVPVQEGCSWLDGSGFTAAEHLVEIA